MYLNDWKDSGLFGMISDFTGIRMSKAEYEAKTAPYNEQYWGEQKKEMDIALKDGDWKKIKVLLASYSYENYSGSAFVLFEKDGKLFEVNGGHCSCYGLEGQWEPSETTIESLEHRLNEGHLGTDSYCGNEFAAELREVLKKLKRRHKK